MELEHHGTAEFTPSAGIEVAVLDRDGVIVAVNGPWTDFCEANNGNPVRTGVGVNYLDVCRKAESAPGAAEVAEAIEIALAGAVPMASRVLIDCHAPHEERWFDVLVLSRADDSGSITGATVMLTQVAEPHADVLDSDQSLARQLLDACPDALVMTDEDGVIESLNRPAERLFGCQRGELLGRAIDTLLAGSFRDPTSNSTQLHAVRRDGSEIPVEVSLANQELGGRPRVVASVRDIRERVRSERRTRLIDRCIDGASDAILVLDEHSLLFEHANQGAVGMFGYERTELVGSMTLRDLAPALSLREIADALGELRESPALHVRLVTTGRSKAEVVLPVEIQIDWPAPERPNAPRPVVVVVRDIGEMPGRGLF